MELPSKISEQIAFNTRPKIEEHMLIDMDQSTHEEHLYQALQTNNKQFKVAITFLTGYNGIFNVTNSNNRFYFRKTITDGDDFIRITIPPRWFYAYEMESLNNEIKRNIIDEGHFTKADYPFQIKPNFSTLGSITTIVPQRPIISFVFNDSIRNLSGFRETILYEDYNLSPNPVDILSFDNFFLECDIAKRMIYKQKRSGMFHNWTMTVNPGYKYVESFAVGFTCYKMQTKDVISSISSKLRNENNELVSFNGQSVSFRISIKEI